MEEVVHDEKAPDVHGLPVLHEIGTPDLDNVDVGGADEHGGERTGHERPAVHSLVPVLPQGVVRVRQVRVGRGKHVHREGLVGVRDVDFWKKAK